uniref:Uncharacterized protein n=1 Tax=viral metagenome TaxID=1070528 RepID=A0A6C0I4T5_9ZZZZ
MEHYPVFDNEYLSAVVTENTTNFKNYLAFADIIVYNMQNKAEESREIPLTFFPIAKNIRMAASYMAKNVLEGKKTYIHNMARPCEEADWKKGTGDDWFPWLWARGRVNNSKESFTNIEGWKCYFNSFTEKANYLLSSYLPMTPPDELYIFFIYLSCTKYVFQLNASYKDMLMKYRVAMGWPVEEKVLAVQIRRGDTCTRDGSTSDRPFFHLDKYIEKMDLMIEKNGYTHFYISTDSDEEIVELQRLRPEWKILSLPIDRSQFFRMDTEPGNIENLCAKYPERIPFVVDSGLADLFFISQCQGYISTISVSEFSRCGWFMQIVEQGELTPYINLNDEPLDMSKRDKLLLF